MSNMEPYQNLSLDNLPNEEWRDIPNYEGFYQASTMGRIKSLDRLVNARNNHLRSHRGKIIRQTPYLNGYLSVMLSVHGIHKRCSVHRLCAVTFLPNIANKPCIDHINTIITDNRIENLRWCTLSENLLNPITVNRISKAKSGAKCYFYGKQFGTRKIRSITINGEETVYPSIIAATKAGIYKYRGIQQCLSGHQKTHRNMRWEYCD